MYAVTGITGKVGGATARALLSAGRRVRAVVRDAEKARPWSDLGCKIALAEMEDGEALTRAFTDATGIFVLPPPILSSLFNSKPGRQLHRIAFPPAFSYVILFHIADLPF